MSFTKIDHYGNKFIAAPKGKVLKAYLISCGRVIEHCLIDSYGSVFAIGMGGWCSLQNNGIHRLIALPNPVDRGNEFNNTSWSWEEWYRRNWRCDSWAWMYARWKSNALSRQLNQP